MQANFRVRNYNHLTKAICTLQYLSSFVLTGKTIFHCIILNYIYSHLWNHNFIELVNFHMNDINIMLQVSTIIIKDSALNVITTVPHLLLVLTYMHIILNNFVYYFKHTHVHKLHTVYNFTCTEIYVILIYDIHILISILSA